MPEEYALDVYPLVDELMRELKAGTGSSSLATSLTRRLKAFGARVTVIGGRSSPAVIMSWARGADQVQRHALALEASA